MNRIRNDSLSNDCSMDFSSLQWDADDQRQILILCATDDDVW